MLKVEKHCSKVLPGPFIPQYLLDFLHIRLGFGKLGGSRAKVPSFKLTETLIGPLLETHYWLPCFQTKSRLLHLAFMARWSHVFHPCHQLYCLPLAIGAHLDNLPLLRASWCFPATQFSQPRSHTPHIRLEKLRRNALRSITHMSLPS